MSCSSCSSYTLDKPIHVTQDEMAWLQGAFLGSLLCGVQITLSAMSFLAVLKQRLHPRLRTILLIYISVLCTVITVGQESNLLYIQTGFVQARNSPGGPNRYLSQRFESPVDVVSTSLYIFANWMMESLLVWRCEVVCRTGDRPVWFGIILPIALLISEFVTGSVFLYQLSRKLQDDDVIKSGIAYSILSLVSNVTVTGIIVVRLLLHRRRLVKQFGPGHGANYVSAATILTESASLYTGFLILFIALTFVGSAATNVLQQLLALLESIASLLIIYRIAQGKGWRSDVCVTSADWRGDSQPRVGPEVIDLEITVDAALTSARAPSIASKGDETPMPKSAHSLNAPLPQEGAV